MNAPLLAAKTLNKSFGGVHAVRDVDFDVKAGEVHALVGENGAGKSTLIKMIGGVLEPDTGSLEVNGAPVRFDSPAAASDNGIQAVHQELELAPALSVAENIFLGRWPARGRFVDAKAMTDQSRAVLALLGAQIDPTLKVRDLSVGDRQVVEIARALTRKASLLILDEPTAALPPREVARLFERIRALRDAGVGIVYISHRLDEVIEIADRITVMRNGRVVDRAVRGQTDRKRLVHQILGRELESLELDRATAVGETVVECVGLVSGERVGELGFRARKGEIVGFFGLLGAGQTILAESLFGATPATATKARIGSLQKLPRRCAEAIAHGIGYVPADRKAESVALGLSIRENLTLAAPAQVTRFGFVDQSQSVALASQLAKDYDVRCASIEQPVGQLSGGNQQKIALAKWAATKSRILILDEPTRGVDVGAKAEIYKLLRRLADDGGCCLLMSSDAEEIATVCDRAYIMRAGRISGEITADSMSTDALLAAVL